jgi:hypothetical protein
VDEGQHAPHEPLDPRREPGSPRRSRRRQDHSSSRPAGRARRKPRCGTKRARKRLFHATASWWSARSPVSTWNPERPPAKRNPATAKAPPHARRASAARAAPARPMTGRSAGGAPELHEDGRQQVDPERVAQPLVGQDRVLGPEGRAPGEVLDVGPVQGQVAVVVGQERQQRPAPLVDDPSELADRDRGEGGEGHGAPGSVALRAATPHGSRERVQRTASRRRRPPRRGSRPRPRGSATRRPRRRQAAQPRGHDAKTTAARDPQDVHSRPGAYPQARSITAQPFHGLRAPFFHRPGPVLHRFSRIRRP